VFDFPHGLNFRTFSAMPATPKKRLDLLLVERGLVSSRQRAQAAILAGEVSVDGKPATKAGAGVAADARITFLPRRGEYVSRGGEKLAGALDDLTISVEGRVCLDVGSSTGGFTDCLLQRGARRVYAVDVSTGQMDWRLRTDPRVVLIEKNARYLKRADVAEPPELVTADVSFISIVKVLPALLSVAAPEAEFLLLVKPQFELERGEVGKGGVVRDPRLHKCAVENVSTAARGAGLTILGVAASRIAGARGNREFFLHARRA
jgi:23S rRNA (cytidine1920-2'-O)/16S rRNA (cytidine1409-2'-O)-methyltransferase